MKTLNSFLLLQPVVYRDFMLPSHWKQKSGGSLGKWGEFFPNIWFSHHHFAARFSSFHYWIVLGLERVPGLTLLFHTQETQLGSDRDDGLVTHWKKTWITGSVNFSIWSCKLTAPLTTTALCTPIPFLCANLKKIPKAFKLPSFRKKSLSKCQLSRLRLGIILLDVSTSMRHQNSVILLYLG